VKLQDIVTLNGGRGTELVPRDKVIKVAII